MSAAKDIEQKYSPNFHFKVAGWDATQVDNPDEDVVHSAKLG